MFRLVQVLGAGQLGLPANVQNSQNPQDRPVTPLKSLAAIGVPEGFQVTLFAAEPTVAQPIAMTFDDRGRLWVAECFSHPVWKPTGGDRISILEDFDGDGRYDRRKIFWDQGNYLTGLAFGHGGVWICNTPNLMFIPDRDGDDQPDGEPVIVLDGWQRDSPHNVVNNLTWGPDGWLYGCIGQAVVGYIGKPGETREERTAVSRGIWRYHPQRAVFEVVATGAVNPWGLDFDDYGEGFFTNCVLAHLWHLVPGAYYERRQGEHDYPYAYRRIGPICDHLHWGGGEWTDSRGGRGGHSVAGGGHAHAGLMIYLGDNWPDRYRHSVFMGNLHGNRINNDRLQRQRSSYVGQHADDFLRGNSPWFRCVAQRYGPDGAVMVSDWHDLGECHDHDGSHRTSGRIYRVSYGATNALGKINLAENSNSDLVQLQLHKNDWYVRHARRLLQERAVRGEEMDQVQANLLRIFESHPDPTRQLRGLWALWAINRADDTFLAEALDHQNEHVRAWAIRLLCDDRNVPAAALQAFALLATQETSALVRLHLAAAMQRIPLDDRWPIARGLVAREEDSGDAFIPAMIWYGIEPLVHDDLSRSLKLLQSSQIPLVRELIARRALSE